MLLMKLLHDFKIDLPAKLVTEHHVFRGMQVRRRRLCSTFPPLIEMRRDAIIEFLDDKFDSSDLAGAYCSIYNSLSCHYENLNDPMKPLRMFVRADPNWPYRPTRDTYDFVAINRMNDGIGLAGIHIGRLEYLMYIELADGSSIGIAGIQCCDRVESPSLLPKYQFTG
jgi:hypothetical protein